MRRISSRSTFFYKRIFPAFWFGFLTVLLAISLFAVPRQGNGPFLLMVIVPLFMMAFGYVFMKKLVFDLVDEVWEDGDALLVRNRNQEQRIALAEIKNVNYSALTSPPRVTLSLRQPGIFGDQIVFCAPLRFVPFASSPVIAELIDRIDTARQKRV